MNDLRSSLLLRILTVVLIVILSFSFLVRVIDLFEFLKANGDGYPIGAENMGADYASRSAYLATSVSTVLVISMGLFLPPFMKNSLMKFVVRFAVVLLLVADQVRVSWELTRLNG